MSKDNKYIIIKEGNHIAVGELKPLADNFRFSGEEKILDIEYSNLLNARKIIIEKMIIAHQDELKILLEDFKDLNEQLSTHAYLSSISR